MANLEKASSSPSRELETVSDQKSTLSHADDEAAKVLNTYDGPVAWDDVEERKLRRKVDWRLMPVLCFTYALQYYDKSMLAQAALFGLIEDLNLGVGGRYAFSSAIFYLGFIAGAYPAMLLAQRYPIERVASVIVTLWGVDLLLTTACFSWRALYVQRFFLGFLEAGVSPMFMLIVGSWYKKDEQAFRMGTWYSFVGWATIVSPLINYGLGHINGALSSWRYMYFFAGALTIVWGIIILFIIPPDPIRARGFSERERYILVARLRTNNSGVRNTHWKKRQIVELLCDLKFWTLFFIAVTCMIMNGLLSTFLPIVIYSIAGVSVLNTLLLLMPAGAWAASVMVFLGYIAYKFSTKNIRTWIIFGCQMMSTLSAALLWKLPDSAKGGRLYASYTVSTMACGYGILMGLQVANVSGYTKRALAASGLYIGYCIGNFIGPLVFLDSEAPGYDTGFLVVTVTSAIAGVLVLVYRGLCVWDNRQRDASGTLEGFDHAYEDPTDKENRQFRYIM